MTVLPSYPVTQLPLRNGKRERKAIPFAFRSVRCGYWVGRLILGKQFRTMDEDGGREILKNIFTWKEGMTLV